MTPEEWAADEETRAAVADAMRAMMRLGRCLDTTHWRLSGVSRSPSSVASLRRAGGSEERHQSSDRDGTPTIIEVSSVSAWPLEVSVQFERLLRPEDLR